MQEQPYFMTNPKWFTFNETEWKYELTKDAPPKAVKSYNDFYATEERIIHGTGNIHQ